MDFQLSKIVSDLSVRISLFNNKGPYHIKKYIDFLWKLMDWFLHGKDLPHHIVKYLEQNINNEQGKIISQLISSLFYAFWKNHIKKGVIQNN